MNRSSLGVLVAVGLAGAVPAGRAAVIVDYPDFSGGPGLTTSGTAAPVATGDGTVLRLVSAGIVQTGAAFHAAPVFLGGGGSFSTRFQFRITAPGGVNPADGFAFVLAAAPSGSGGWGGGIGYGGVPNSVAVEFDVFNNGAEDGNSSNHVGVDANGSTSSLALASPYGVRNCTFASGFAKAGCLANGNVWTATIAYDGARLSVTVQDGAAAPDTVISGFPIGIGAMLGAGAVYAGFTGSTGYGYENEDILNWRLADTAALPERPTAVPEPATVVLLGGGLVGLALVRRRRGRAPAG